MQTLTLQQIFDIIAEEKARRHFEKVKILKSKDSFEDIKKQRVETNLKILQSQIKESKPEIDLWDEKFGYYFPFDSLDSQIELPNRIVILADTLDLKGKHTCFYMNSWYNTSNESFILNLTPAQREDTYVIYKGVIQSFKVENGEVLYEDELIKN